MAKKPLRIFSKDGQPIELPPDKPVTLYQKGDIAVTQQILEIPETYRLKMVNIKESNYGQLLNAIYDAVLITDSGGWIQEVNTRAEIKFKAPSEELRRRNITNLISGADEHLVDLIHRNVDMGKYTMIEATCVRMDKTKFYAEIAVNSMILRGMRKLCFFVRDVTKKKLEAKEKEKLYNQILELEKQRAKFDLVTQLIQEIRNPLQVLQSMAELEKNNAYLEQITRISIILDKLKKEIK